MYSEHPESILLGHRDLGVNKLYCFETWSRQLLDFIDNFIGKEPTFLICNSVGGASLSGNSQNLRSCKKLILRDAPLHILTWPSQQFV